MKNTSARKNTGKALLIAAIVAVALFFVFGSQILAFLNEYHCGLKTGIGTRLVSDHDLVLLADFDDSIPIDVVSGKKLKYWDVPRVDGKFGYARKISLASDPVIQIPVTKFAVRTNQFTFAAWFNPVNISRRQILFAQNNESSSFQLILSRKQLHLVVSDAVTNLYTACKFTGKIDKFTHVALVIDGGAASIWQNGEETARIPLGHAIEFSSRLLPYGVDGHHPFEGCIDELAIWKRALTQDELVALAQSVCGIRQQYEPVLSFTESTSAKIEKLVAGTYRSVGRLVPPLLNPAPIAKDIPKITIWLSEKDERHFLKAHEESLAFGYRTKRAAEFRVMNVSFCGKTVQAEVALDDVYGRSDAKRMAFIVKDPSRDVFGGSGIIRLYPPELHTALHSDAMCNLPLSGEFVRLFHKDSFKGLYAIESFDRVGGAWMARGERDPKFKRALYFDSNPSPCDYPPPGIDMEEAFDSTSSLVLSDIFFPWGRLEIRTRLNEHLRNRELWRFNPLSNRNPVLGHIVADNPSLMYVTNDLALDMPGLTWESSDPELVSSGGDVSRPAGGAPRSVILTPVRQDDGTRGEPVRVRVIPEKSDIQTLFFHVGFPVEKHRHTDFVCYRVPAGGGTPEWLTGFASSNAGIKHRGNTSYVKGAKRSFSVEFDKNTSWPDTGREARHVLLFSGYADPTRLRNKISFDSYRAAATEAVPCGAIGVTWSEVFINGEYFGIWETSRRVKDVCDPLTALYKVRASKSDLWMRISSDMVDCVSEYDLRSNPYYQLEDLFEFTSTASRESFASLAESTFYMDSLVDYYLMLNFTENFDGQFTNQLIARRKGEKQWFLVPWDYDKTFFDDQGKTLSNRLFARMFADVPGFKERLSGKWKALRAGPMSDAAVFGRIDADAALLAPYMDDEYRLLQPAGWDGDYAAAVDHLRTVVAGRLKLMDGRFGVAGQNEPQSAK